MSLDILLYYFISLLKDMLLKAYSFSAISIAIVFLAIIKEDISKKYNQNVVGKSEFKIGAPTFYSLNLS